MLSGGLRRKRRYARRERPPRNAPEGKARTSGNLEEHRKLRAPRASFVRTAGCRLEWDRALEFPVFFFILWLHSLRESSHRHPSHDGIRDWHLHSERGPNAGAVGSREQIFPCRVTGEGGGVRRAATELPRGAVGRTRRYAEEQPRFSGNRAASGVRPGSHSASVLDAARARLSLCSDRTRPAGAYVWIARPFQFAAQLAFLSDTAGIA